MKNLLLYEPIFACALSQHGIEVYRQMAYDIQRRLHENLKDECAALEAAELLEEVATAWFRELKV